MDAQAAATRDMREHQPTKANALEKMFTALMIEKKRYQPEAAENR